MLGNLCPKCGAVLDFNAKKCSECGYNIEEGKIRENYIREKVIRDWELEPGINPNWKVKSKIVAGIFAILLGDLGIHHFYLGDIVMGIIYLLFFWTGIPGIIGIIEGIIYLTTDDYRFQVNHKVRVR